jgi:hypothetical protein
MLWGSCLTVLGSKKQQRSEAKINRRKNTRASSFPSPHSHQAVQHHHGPVASSLPGFLYVKLAAERARGGARWCVVCVPRRGRGRCRLPDPGAQVLQQLRHADRRGCRVQLGRIWLRRQQVRRLLVLEQGERSKPTHHATRYHHRLRCSTFPLPVAEDPIGRGQAIARSNSLLIYPKKI